MITLPSLSNLPPKRVSIAEAMQTAQQLHAQGDVASAEKIYKLMVDNELEFVSENIDHIDEPIDFETFVKEVHDNDVLYNLLIISSNSQNEFDEKIRTLYADFMEDFIDIWD